MNLISATNTSVLDGKNESHGGSVGVGLNFGGSNSGFTVNASANKGKGSESGNGVTHTETTLNAGNNLNIVSGRDTTLTGAQLTGDKVTMDVGRNLTLTSEQDSDNYDSKQQNVSGGVSVGTGGSASINLSRDKMHSTYDSVKEQTGIFAGKGGFDITVGEHTQLNGSVIGSTADAGKNRLDTGTLGFGDIENRADYRVEHQSVGMSTGGQFVGNMANSLLVGVNGKGSDSSTTQSAVSDGSIVIRDKDKQTQNVADLSRDVEHANQTLSPIFDKEKEQRRLQEAQKIGEIGSQVSDIARTQGDINGLNEAKKTHPGMSADELRKTDVYKAEMKKYGTGSALQQGLQAATAAIQGLAGGDMAKAIAGGSAPYLAEVIHKMTTDPVTGNVDRTANLMAHAVVNAALAAAQGNNAAAGAAGAVSGEMVGMIAQQMYGKKADELSEREKQTVSTLATLAAGLAGGLTGDSSADAVAGAQAGKNAVENNYLSVNEKSELEIQKQKVQNSKDPAGREKAQQKVNELIELDISRDQKVIDACGNGKAASPGCANARLEVIAAKGEYENTGNYYSKASQQYSDAYSQIVNLLNITSVDAQNQQQVKDAMVNYAMVQLDISKATAEAYIETYNGMRIVAASMSPVLGAPAANKLAGLGKEVVAKQSGVSGSTANWNSYLDSEKAIQQSALMKQQVTDIRAGLSSTPKRSGNVAVADVNIPGMPKQMAAHSGVDEAGKGLVGEGSQNFQYQTLPNNKGIPIGRNTDSEYKILDNLADQLGSNTSAKGTVTIFTERPACGSCLGVVEQFQQKYPDIQVDVLDNNGVLLRPGAKK